jgi:hypothetical protein
MTLDTVRRILQGAQDSGMVRSIYFEGGEPFLYYPILLKGVEMAAEAGFNAGIVSNAYWATTLEDARTWLAPFAGKLSDLSVSSDLFHYNERDSLQARNASQAASELDISIGVISIARPEQAEADFVEGQLPAGESGVMYRGRAAEKLAPAAPKYPWDTFTSCPYENLVDPGRIHVDPLGNLHLCQGIVMGNLLERPLTEICKSYEPASHPIVGPILEAGPRRLVEMYDLPHAPVYADACHLCYQARLELRGRFPEFLRPDQVYGTY